MATAVLPSICTGTMQTVAWFLRVSLLLSHSPIPALLLHFQRWDILFTGTCAVCCLFIDCMSANIQNMPLYFALNGKAVKG